MPTTSHGLVYPDSTGSVELWTHIQNLAESADTALECLIGSRTHAAATSIANNTWTSIAYDTVELDEIPWNAGSTWWTVPVAGYYQINAAASFAANATGWRGARIQVNGTVVATGIHAVSTASNGASCAISRGRKLAAGDHVVIQCIQNSGGALALAPGASQVWGDITLVGLA